MSRLHHRFGHWTRHRETARYLSECGSTALCVSSLSCRPERPRRTRRTGHPKFSFSVCRPNVHRENESLFETCRAMLCNAFRLVHQILALSLRTRSFTTQRPFCRETGTFRFLEHENDRPNHTRPLRPETAIEIPVEECDR